MVVDGTIARAPSSIGPALLVELHPPRKGNGLIWVSALRNLGFLLGRSFGDKF
ncbi:hypothetical protein ADIS_1873 [Lunatimonas lonarensis]|uniref:Uncharacterized protein n=1 Tax=Lunatimonas lonarensis TaxID=1232681 RepID=R7ZUJ9_9BACT|nr:hypothetical protein ADIS_1873 [Lunatimonas lonarensis]